jgi:phosphoribosylcarboxyaminoimidazole (NCAIR) mutase
MYSSQLTVAIGHATNAGLLAVRIVSTNRHDWRQPMIQYPTENERNGQGSECQIDTFSDAFFEQMENKNTSVNV